VRAAGPGGWDFIGKLDGDIQLPSNCFERLLAEFARDPELGIVEDDAFAGSVGGSAADLAFLRKPIDVVATGY
jgi:hypothetical protein